MSHDRGLLSVSAKICHRSCLSRKFTKNVTAAFGRNQMYADSAPGNTFAAETEIHSTFKSGDPKITH